MQIAIAKKVSQPDPDEVAFAQKVIAAIPDGRGVHMIDGKMQDDATWKQCKVMVNLAEMLAKKDPELAEAYGLGMRAARRGHPRVLAPLACAAGWHSEPAGQPALDAEPAMSRSQTASEGRQRRALLQSRP